MTTANSLDWITNYLLSTVDAEEKDAAPVRGFSEALAKAINFCFTEMQHDSLSVSARTAAAEAGCRVSNLVAM
jgi:senataxin